MTRLISGWLFISISFSACTELRPLSPNCEWTDESALLLDLRNPVHQRHLNHDALVAEELAIRYADARRGHRSGQFKGIDEYQRIRGQCLAALSGVIASHHGIAPEQVIDAVGQRDGRLDGVVVLLIGGICGLCVRSSRIRQA